MTETKLKPCPICGGGAKLSKAGYSAFCPNGATCRFSGVHVPVDVWQSIPRQSDALRNVIGIVQSVACSNCHPSGAAHSKLMGAIDRLSQIADEGECECSKLPKTGKYTWYHMDNEGLLCESNGEEVLPEDTISDWLCCVAEI